MESLVPLAKIIFPRLPVFTHGFTSIHKPMHETQSLKPQAAYISKVISLHIYPFRHIAYRLVC